MNITLTELRQRLFKLADQVIDSGEPLIIERRGVRLKLMREDLAPAAFSRLNSLVPRDITIGPPLRPEESVFDYDAWRSRHDEQLTRMVGTAPAKSVAAERAVYVAKATKPASRPRRKKP